MHFPLRGWCRGHCITQHKRGRGHGRWSKHINSDMGFNIKQLFDHIHSKLNTIYFDSACGIKRSAVICL